MIELLSGSRFSTCCIPRLAGWICWERAAIWVLFSLLGCLIMLFMRLLQCRHRHTHVFGQSLSIFVKLHDSTTCVMLAVPDDLIGSSLVQAEPEWRLVLPHLASHII